MRQIALVLAQAGHRVSGLSTSVCEGDPGLDPVELMREAGAEVRARPTTGRGPRWWEARLGGIVFEVVAVDQRKARSWENEVGDAYDQRLEALCRNERDRPEVVLTFGGDATDAARRQRLRAAGATVVFALHNLAYRSARPPAVDAWLAPTRWLASRYEAAWPEETVTVLPPPIDPAHARADEADPVCVGFFNPEPAKGAALVVRLAERLKRERPDVPLLVVGGRAPAGEFARIAARLGVSLEDMPGLLAAEPTARVADLLGACRVVLMPSVVEEAAGRLPVEAMLNGAVALVSDRGGLPEMVGAAGVVLPMPESVTLAHPWEFPAETIEAWWRALLRAVDDETWREDRATAGRRHAEVFAPTALRPRYAAWLQQTMATARLRSGISG